MIFLWFFMNFYDFFIDIFDGNSLWECPTGCNQQFNYYGDMFGYKTQYSNQFMGTCYGDVRDVQNTPWFGDIMHLKNRGTRVQIMWI